MIELLLALPDIVGAAVAMVIAAVLGLAVYLTAYKLISKHQSDELKDPTSSLFRVVGMLVSLMLSLAFADVILQMRVIENAIERAVVLARLRLHAAAEAAQLRVDADRVAAVAARDATGRKLAGLHPPDTGSSAAAHGGVSSSRSSR